MSPETPFVRTLSKSDFKIARECDAKLFFRENGFEDASGFNQYLRLLAQGGYMVEALACAQRPSGITLQYGRDHAADFADTLAHLGRDTVTLFQATLLWQRRLARVDILEKRGNVIRLLEVKAKSFDSVAHSASLESGGPGVMRTKKGTVVPKWLEKIEDIAFQVVMLERVMPGVTVQPFLVLVDKAKRSSVGDAPDLFEIETRVGRHGTDVQSARFIGTPGQLAGLDVLIEVDVSREVDLVRGYVDAEAERFEAMLDAEFNPAWSRHSADCRSCQFNTPDAVAGSGFEKCWGELAHTAPHILELHRAGMAHGPGRRLPLVEHLLAEGSASLLDVRDEWLTSKDGSVGSMSEWQRRQVSHTRAGTTWMSDALEDNLGALQYPLSYIDFEASRLALPYHAGMRPYGQVAFQWSCHTVSAPGELPRHSEWLNAEPAWPNMDFVRTLRTALGDHGSVLTWTSYEASQLKEIIAEHPVFVEHDVELAEWVRQLIDERFVDLHKWACKDFYHPGMRGRTSIKVVLDALWRSDAAMREQFTAWTGSTVSEDDDPYSALPPLVIAGVRQSVHEGTGAVKAYEAMMYGAERRDASARASWRKLLLQYCELDTLSMVLVCDHWRRLTGLGGVPAYSPVQREVVVS